MSDPFIGEIRMFGGNFAPLGWAFCDGRLLSIAENDALFSLIGTTYGGDGQITFALPDLRGRLPLHQGQGNGLSNHVMGERGGEETVTLTQNQIPSHAHALNGTAVAATSRSPANALLARPDDPIYGPPEGAGGGTVGLSPGAIDLVGGAQPHSNIQPFLCVNFIIALFGIYPQRN